MRLHSSDLPASVTVDDPTPTTGRRSLLRLGGASLLGAAAVAGVAGTARADQPTSGRSHQGNSSVRPTRSVATVAELQALSPTRDDVVVVNGYTASGDGGSLLVRWDPDSAATPNGGTVIAASSGGTGRWLLVHDGTVDFRQFGVLGPDAPADDALDAMVADPAVQRIEAYTDLNFVRRHRFSRSDLVVDFGHHLVTTEGIEAAAANDPFAAVLFFQGAVTAEVVTGALPADLPEQVDILPVPDSAAFTIGQWWAVQTDPRPGGGSAERELMYLLQITQIVDGTHVRVGYKTGWALTAGRTLTWTRVDPVQRVTVQRMRFRGTGSDQLTGSHPVAFEYATHCDVHAIDAEGTFWPVIMRRWNTTYVTSQCSLRNPVSVTLGGAGYLTQQISCLYAQVRDCRTSNARHLNDFTCAAYSMVQNCHGDGDVQGPFVTHGQYEHDLTYIGNSGLMTFANSGATWGGRAKRVTVRQQVTALFFARVGVIDLTLEDCQVVKDPSMPDYPSWMWVNADGLQMRGCRVDARFQLSQATAVSARPTVIEDCVIGLSGADATLPFIAANVTTPVHLVRTTITGLDGATTSWQGTGPLTLTGCTLRGTADGAGAPIPVAASRLTMDGTTLENTGVLLNGAADQELSATGTHATGGPSTGAVLGRSAGGARSVSWNLDGHTGTAARADLGHIRVTDGVNHYRATGSTFIGGALELSGFATGSTLMHTACVERGVVRDALPPTGAGVLTDGNLVV
ncbi:peptidase C14 [Cellulomonas sp. RIT-PI-Y]|uniref:peptidase C14 n=1 Tax=Cellulomonas sp. RIT-PI-Y TaxID=3035297 RepID=UPI0021D803DF|nr:peptidase C14 [Cellulomonas sp. RIT-PI-Y]